MKNHFGARTKQQVAHIALDVYDYCLTQALTDGGMYRLDPNDIYYVSYAAIQLLDAAEAPLNFRMSHVETIRRATRRRTRSAKKQTTLFFERDVLATIRKWKIRLGFEEEQGVVAEALTLLEKAITAKKCGQSVTISVEHGGDVITHLSQNPCLNGANTERTREAYLLN